MNKKINITVIKINDLTTKMFNLLKENVSKLEAKFTILDLKKVIEASTSSLTQGCLDDLINRETC